MRKVILAVTAAFVLAGSGWLTPDAAADGMPVARHKVRHVCHGPKCGPYTPCGWRCRIVCTDRYSCWPLYGAYGPYGGLRYWGAYTFTGWGYR